MNTCLMIGFVFPTYFLQVPVFKPEPYSRAQYAYLRISVTWLCRDVEWQKKVHAALCLNGMENPLMPRMEVTHFPHWQGKTQLVRHSSAGLLERRHRWRTIRKICETWNFLTVAAADWNLFSGFVCFSCTCIKKKKKNSSVVQNRFPPFVSVKTKCCF